METLLPFVCAPSVVLIAVGLARACKYLPKDNKQEINRTQPFSPNMGIAKDSGSNRPMIYGPNRGHQYSGTKWGNRKA